MQYKWKTGGLRRNWNFAFCLLEGPFLYLLSSEDHEKQKQKGVVPLAGCHARTQRHDGAKFESIRHCHVERSPV